ncbi:hypothetical protein cgR_6076 [Corynebacterium glutamicum R]|uniref:Uncharacterized protein n=1 Tax=Corynebacterium glutamicum (strain R) TaxID=340322 RepID=A0AB72VF89_CORGB|nr:hypothetical protein cgR_6076 [Corynebacterium glutamicum R]
MTHSCPAELRVPGMPWQGDPMTAISDADIIIIDGLGSHTDALTSYQVTGTVLDADPSGIDMPRARPAFAAARPQPMRLSTLPAFVGYRFKQNLKPVQQAVISWALGDSERGSGESATSTINVPTVKGRSTCLCQPISRRFGRVVNGTRTGLSAWTPWFGSRLVSLAPQQIVQ